MVEFYAPWCSYCVRLEPVMEKICGQYPELSMAQINIDEAPQLAHDEQIELVPTLVIYRGGKALGAVVAPESRAAVQEFIENTIG